MAEDPRYLRNQSRVVHRLHRRNKWLLRWGVTLWLIAVLAFTAAAAFDVIANLGWGHEPRNIWIGLLMAAGGCAFWVFATTVSNVVLAISRRLYGPEPMGPAEGAE